MDRLDELFVKKEWQSPRPTPSTYPLDNHAQTMDHLINAGLAVILLLLIIVVIYISIKPRGTRNRF